MKRNKLMIAIASIAFVSAVFADENKIDYSFGIKNWNNALNVANKDSNVNTQSVNSPILSLTAKKGDYFATVSTLLESSYRYRTVWLARKDTDFALGYRVTENISILGGYKTWTMKDGSLSNWVDTLSGYTIGVSGFKSIDDSIFAYGNYIHMPSLKYSGNGTDVIQKAHAFSSEIGIGKSINATTQLVAGYRYQNMKNYNATQVRDETVTVRGGIAGLNINF